MHKKLNQSTIRHFQNRIIKSQETVENLWVKYMEAEAEWERNNPVVVVANDIHLVPLFEGGVTAYFRYLSNPFTFNMKVSELRDLLESKPPFTTTKNGKLVAGRGEDFYLQLQTGDDGGVCRHYNEAFTDCAEDRAWLAKETGWTDAQIDWHIVRAGLHCLVEENSLEGKRAKITRFVEEGLLDAKQAEEFINAVRLGNIEEEEERRFIGRYERQLKQLDEEQRRLAKEFAKEERETEREATRMEKEEKRLEKLKSSGMPKTKTIEKVYQALKSACNSEWIVDLGWDKILELAGVSSRTTLSKVLTELKEAGIVQELPGVKKAKLYKIVQGY